MNKSTAIIIIALFVVGAIAVIFNDSFKNVSSQKTLWVHVISPDRKLSMDLPDNFEIDVSIDDSEFIPGYVYTAYEQRDFVTYVVKYEDYTSILDFTKKEMQDESEKHTFLKTMMESNIEDFNMLEFSSAFVKYKEYEAVKFNGKLYDNGLIDIAGIIILVDNTTYSIIALSEEYKQHNFERILDSLVIR